MGRFAAKVQGGGGARSGWRGARLLGIGEAFGQGGGGARRPGRWRWCAGRGVGWWLAGGAARWAGGAPAGEVARGEGGLVGDFFSRSGFFTGFGGSVPEAVLLMYRIRL